MAKEDYPANDGDEVASHGKAVAMAHTIREVSGEARCDGRDSEDRYNPRLSCTRGKGRVEQSNDRGREKVDSVGSGASADVDDDHEPDLPV